MCGCGCPSPPGKEEYDRNASVSVCWSISAHRQTTAPCCWDERRNFQVIDSTAGEQARRGDY